MEILEMTINHYKSFCRDVYIYDNWSDDGSYELAEKMGCVVQRFGKRNVLDDKIYLDIKNYCWKKSSADWVIICDTDEIVWHPKIIDVLSDATNQGFTVQKTYGWNIYSNELPERDLLEINTGIPDRNYSKWAVFNPKALREIGYIYGCHRNNARGRVIQSFKSIPLFHYRNIGGIERLMLRHEQYRDRLSDFNKKLGLGCHYLYDDERRKEEYKNGIEQSKAFTEINTDWMA